MAPRLGKPICQCCAHPERSRIESLRASGASLDSLAKKFGLHRDCIWRHWKDHVSADAKINFLAAASTIEALRERAAAEGGTLLDYLTSLRIAVY